MERLNYFNPYNSKTANHEDQLTRAYLVLLKHSYHVLSCFISYINKKNTEKEKVELIDIIGENIEFETQKSNPFIDTNFLFSVLITDENINNENIINRSDRNAVYDGLLTFGKKYTMIIENKPSSNNVWFDQLNPSNKNLSEETIIVKSSIILEWKTIIKHLTCLKSIETINGFEKIMIEDFLDYIDECFPYLNPYDNFKLCKSNSTLLYRRINNILKEIVKSDDLIKYHQGWGYYIETPYDAIKKIGLILNQSDNSWRLDLSLYYGDSQGQAKAFYNTNPDISKLNNKCYSHPNFHVSFITSNLYWFYSDKNEHKNYIDFWIKNKNLIYQHKKDDVHTLLKKLKDKKVIKFNEKDKENIEDKFFKTEMKTLNICPGFGVITELSSNFCEQNDYEKNLSEYIAKQIINGLKICNYNASEILKEKYCR